MEKRRWRRSSKTRLQTRQDRHQSMARLSEDKINQEHLRPENQTDKILNLTFQTDTPPKIGIVGV